MNQAAVTIQRWYRRHARRRLASHTALRRFLATKRKVCMSPWGGGVFMVLPWTLNICICMMFIHVFLSGVGGESLGAAATRAGAAAGATAAAEG